MSETSQVEDAAEKVDALPADESANPAGDAEDDARAKREAEMLFEFFNEVFADMEHLRQITVGRHPWVLIEYPDAPHIGPDTAGVAIRRGGGIHSFKAIRMALTGAIRALDGGVGERMESGPADTVATPLYVHRIINAMVDAAPVDLDGIDVPVDVRVRLEEEGLIKSPERHDETVAL